VLPRKFRREVLRFGKEGFAVDLGESDFILEQLLSRLSQSFSVTLLYFRRLSVGMDKIFQ